MEVNVQHFSFVFPIVSVQERVHNLAVFPTTYLLVCLEQWTTSEHDLLNYYGFCSFVSFCCSVCV